MNLHLSLRLLTLILLTALGSQVLAQNQSPFLEGKDLPPVAERLPENPMVIEPFEGLHELRRYFALRHRRHESRLGRFMVLSRLGKPRFLDARLRGRAAQYCRALGGQRRRPRVHLLLASRA